MRRWLAVAGVVLVLVMSLWTVPVVEAQVWTYGSVAREMWDTLSQAERLRLAGIVFGTSATTATVATSLTACVASVWCGALLLTAGLTAGVLARLYLDGQAADLTIGQSTYWYQQGSVYFRLDRVSDGTGSASTWFGCSIPAGIAGARYNVYAQGNWKFPDGTIANLGPLASQNLNQARAVFACLRPSPNYNTYPGNPTDAEALDTLKTKQVADPTGVQGKLGTLVNTLPDDRAGVEAKGVTLNPPYGASEPAPPPAPGGGTDAPTQTSQKGLFQWLGDLIGSWFSWLGSLVTIVTRTLTELPQAIWDKFLTGLQTLFVPDMTTLQSSLEALRTTMSTRLPFSLVSISLPTDPGAPTCPSNQLKLEFPEMVPTTGPVTVNPEEIPGFCTVVDAVRKVLQATMWFMMAMWLKDVAWPKVHI